ncbi:MAG: hypothetical protein ACKOED_13745 [Aestuariivirga sp.]|uniref:hypothetical protein n=1 Tax=Aestuariivirga sp. TaxID=2650926 RepID=UPI0038D1A47E
MRLIALVAVMTALGAGPAFAHAAGRGFVMLLPTGYVVAGGALAVLVSFIALSLLSGRTLRLPPAGGAERPAFGRILSLISAVILGFLIIIGFLGPRDPAENLLPLTIWTLWWVVIVMLHPLFGDLWAKINPFTGLHALLTGCWRTRDSKALLRYPDWLSYWPAVWVFFAFAWFQLVFPAPEDPAILAAVVLCYALASVAAILLFGPAQWLGKADPFAVFFSQLGAAAPLGPRGWRWPGLGLLALPALPASGVLFVLLTLSTITFDGFANTFLWLSMIGVNPLDYPGRSAVLEANTLGLISSFAILACGFFAAVALGWAWAGRTGDLRRLCGRLVFSLIPISIAYHFAHYLSDTLLALQYAVVALNDPLQNGAQFLGLGHVHVTASFQNTASGAFALYTTQTAAIVIGHVVGVAVAHAMVSESTPSRVEAFKLELPLAICMVAYTGLGLWLLGAPSIA